MYSIALEEESDSLTGTYHTQGSSLSHSVAVVVEWMSIARRYLVLCEEVFSHTEGGIEKCILTVALAILGSKR